MDSGTTQVGIRRGGMPGKSFPTVGHPPINILVGEGSLEIVCDGNFPRLWHQEQPIRQQGCLGNHFPHLVIFPGCFW